MLLRIWPRPATMNEIIVMLQQATSFVGEAAQVAFTGDHLEITFDPTIYSEDAGEQNQFLDELVGSISAFPFVKEVAFEDKAREI